MNAMSATETKPTSKPTLVEGIAKYKRYISHFAILTVGHYSYVWTYPNPGNVEYNITDAGQQLFDTTFHVMWYWMIIAWSAILGCEYLDRTKSTMFKKLKPPKFAQAKGQKEPSFNMQLPVVVRNMFFAISWAFGCGYFLHWYVKPFTRSEHDSLLRTFVWFFVHLATADVVFYTSHVAMHQVPWARKTHLLHHTSWAISGLAGYYMSPIDFFFEHLSAFLALFFWGEFGPQWVATIAAGSWNVVLSHSGYDFPFGPDPRQHWLHHAKYKVNYGIILDKVFNTQLAEHHADGF